MYTTSGSGNNSISPLTAEYESAARRASEARSMPGSSPTSTSTSKTTTLRSLFGEMTPRSTDRLPKSPRRIRRRNALTMSSQTCLPVRANDGSLTAGRREASASSSASKSSSTKEAIIAAIQQHREQSNNLYRQDQAQPEESLLRVSSREAESELSVRLKKPARAVFEDLPTAHSSITSRLGRTKNRTTSTKLLAADDDDNAIPLQDLNSAKHRRDTSFLRNLPLPFSPAVTYDERHGGYDYQDDRGALEQGG